MLDPNSIEFTFCVTHKINLILIFYSFLCIRSFHFAKEVVFAKTLEEERARLVASSTVTTTEEKIGDGIINQTNSFSNGEKVRPTTTSLSSIITANNQPTKADDDVDAGDYEEEDGWGSDGWGDDD